MWSRIALKESIQTYVATSFRYILSNYFKRLTVNTLTLLVVGSGFHCTHFIIRRVDHLKDGSREEEVGELHQKQWRKVRLERILVEHFLRSGFYQSAIQLAQASNLQDMTNIEVFLAAKEVEESLQAGNISKCLAWCHENKSKLRKMKSNLEFNVRIQVLRKAKEN